MDAVIGEKALPLAVAQWVQGDPTDFDREAGRVVLVEVFQVNCPGCFLYGLPYAIDLYRRYGDRGLTVIGLATAFEDFDKNTLENLKLLAEQGEVVGDTLEALIRYERLRGSKLPYAIPFPLAMDHIEVSEPVRDLDFVALQFVRERVPHFDSQASDVRMRLLSQVKGYLRAKTRTAVTFERYGLQGTPSQILVDKQGILRDVSFGQDEGLDGKIVALLED